MIHSHAIIIAKWPAANVHVAVTGISRQLTHVTRTTRKYSACLFYICVAGNFCALKISCMDQNKGVNHYNFLCIIFINNENPPKFPVIWYGFIFVTSLVY